MDKISLFPSKKSTILSITKKQSINLSTEYFPKENFNALDICLHLLNFQFKKRSCNIFDISYEICGRRLIVKNNFNEDNESKYSVNIYFLPLYFEDRFHLKYIISTKLVTISCESRVNFDYFLEDEIRGSKKRTISLPRNNPSSPWSTKERKKDVRTRQFAIGFRARSYC